MNIFKNKTLVKKSFHKVKSHIIKMVKEIKKKNKNYYQCEICKFTYRNKTLAEKCQDWCKAYNSCNIEITKYAIKI